MPPVAWVVVALVVVAILGITFAEKHEKNASASPPPPLDQPDQRTETATFAAPDPTPVPPKSPAKKFREQLTSFTALGENFETAFDHAMAATGELGIEEALVEAVRMRYSIAEIAALMFKQNRPLAGIMDFISDNTVTDLGEDFAVFTPLVAGNSPKEKAENIIAAMKTVWDFDDEGEAMINALSALGCNTEETAEIVYRETSMRLGDIILAMNPANSPLQPEAIALIATKLGVDLSESEEYEILRNGNFGFAEAGAILKGCGKGAGEIVDAEFAYNTVELYEVKDLYDGLAKAGFGPGESMNAIWETDLGESDGALVAALLEAGVPMSEIIAALKERNIDPDTLNDDFSEDNVDISLRDRVRILHALFEPEAAVKAPE